MNLNISASFARGYCTVNGELKGYGIERTETAPAPVDALTAYIKLIDSYESLYRELDVSVSASLSGWIGSASAKADFARQTRIEQFRSYMLVKIAIQLDRRTLTNPTLTRDALRLLNQKDDGKAFLDTFGDKFISDVTTGGELYGIISFQNFASQDKQYTDVQIEGQSGSVDVGLALQERIERITKISTAEIQMYRQGTWGPLPGYKSFLDYALNFPKEVHDTGGAEIAYIFSNYSDAGNRPPVEMPNLDDKEDLVNGFVRAQRRISDTATLITTIEAHPYQFTRYDNAILMKASKTVAGWQRKLNQALLPLMRSPVFETTVLPDINFDQVVNSLPGELSRYDVPISISVNSGAGTRNGGGDEWIGVPGQVITEVTGEFAVPVDDLDIMFECHYIYVSRGGGFQPNPYPKDSGMKRFAEAGSYGDGMVGLRLWLSGGLAREFSIAYQVDTTNRGIQTLAHDGQPCGLWGGGLAPLGDWPRITRVNVLVTSRG